MDNRSLRELVISYLGGRCNHCGATEHLDIHHIIPLYADGINDMGNVELACRSCHRKLHAQLVKLYPAAERETMLDRAVVKANIEIEEADKAEAIEAVRNLVALGAIEEKDVPEWAKG